MELFLFFDSSRGKKEQKKEKKKNKKGVSLHYY
jgi:hypothetical protein